MRLITRNNQRLPWKSGKRGELTPGRAGAGRWAEALWRYAQNIHRMHSLWQHAQFAHFAHSTPFYTILHHFAHFTQSLWKFAQCVGQSLQGHVWSRSTLQLFPHKLALALADNLSFRHFCFLFFCETQRSCSQGSINCWILQSRIGEHGDILENIEKMEKMNHMS